jgi:hypothetical protein
MNISEEKLLATDSSANQSCGIWEIDSINYEKYQARMPLEFKDINTCDNKQLP